tara:strand:- start:443 stop:601 length:159 start_codon:yes stop_codon:yes gene_type:complete
MNHPFNVIVHLLKEYNQAIQNKEYVKAYEVAVDITEQAQKLEDFAQESANAD